MSFRGLFCLQGGASSRRLTQMSCVGPVCLTSAGASNPSSNLQTQIAFSTFNGTDRTLVDFDDFGQSPAVVGGKIHIAELADRFVSLKEKLVDLAPMVRRRRRI